MDIQGTFVPKYAHITVYGTSVINIQDNANTAVRMDISDLCVNLFVKTVLMTRATVAPVGVSTDVWTATMGWTVTMCAVSCANLEDARGKMVRV